MKTYLELEEVELLELAASCLRDKLLIRLLSRLGCRISEALAIRHEDIDFKQKTVTIIHLKRTLKSFCPLCKSPLAKNHRFCPGCASKIGDSIKRLQEKRRIRILPVDEDTIEMLKIYMCKNKPATINGQAFLFNINRHRAWQIVRNCARRAGIPSLVNPETCRIQGVSPRRLRDAFSVHAMKIDNSGDGLRLLQEHLGHASFDTTAKYRKIAGDEHR
ncbi:MAG: tyrosine-type recombinase/integrase, partial [Candidatus Hodarchaeota archaeon]